MQEAIEQQNRSHRQDADRQAMREVGPSGPERPQPHGQATVILLANIAPKLELSPLRKFCSPSFCALTVPSFGRWKLIWQAAGAPTSLTGSLSANLKSTKNVGSKTSSASSFGFTGFCSGRVKCRIKSPSL